MRGCNYPDCLAPHVAKGWCNGHYRQMRLGQPMRPVKFIVKRGDTRARDDQGNKQCRKCLTWKPEDAYTSNPANRDGLQTICRDCVAWDHKLRKYGMTKEQFEELLKQQAYVCSVCLTEPEIWHIDHDHTCCPAGGSCGDCVRGLLCGPCNRAIGLLGENVERLRRATSYLDRHTNRRSTS